MVLQPGRRPYSSRVALLCWQNSDVVRDFRCRRGCNKDCVCGMMTFRLDTHLTWLGNLLGSLEWISSLFWAVALNSRWNHSCLGSPNRRALFCCRQAKKMYVFELLILIDACSSCFAGRQTKCRRMYAIDHGAVLRILQQPSCCAGFSIIVSISHDCL